jgi:hypothetical protein
MKNFKAPYHIILIGLALFFAGMGIDLIQHGLDFLVEEFQGSPLAHGLPLLGIVLVIVGTVLVLVRTKKD